MHNETNPDDTMLNTQQNYPYVQLQTSQPKVLTQQQQQGHFTTQSVNMSKQQTYNPQNNDDVDSDGEKDDKPKKARRRKIKIEYIKDKSKRHITFSKRKGGIMKKVYELSTLTGTQALLLVASETGHVYTFATPKLQPLITKIEGKNLIQACLNAPDNAPEEEEEDEEEDYGAMNMEQQQQFQKQQEMKQYYQQQQIQQFQQQQQQLQNQQLQQNQQQNINSYNAPVMKISMNQQKNMNQYQ
eukprot:gene3829-6990_t